MFVAGKVWGKTAQLFANAAFELHRLEVKAQHRCSKHKHATKFNGFYVESGTVLVTVWQPSGTVDQTHLKPGETMVVPPGVFHQFAAATDSIIFEFYWTELHSADIEREDVGE
jgi:mannose-6-phosphate isomerase-like protein (cupin superfamily)